MVKRRFERLWNTAKRMVTEWLEWQDAKAWAKEYHPAWVEIAIKSHSEEARKYYKEMILSAYRGAEYV